MREVQRAPHVEHSPTNCIRPDSARHLEGTVSSVIDLLREIVAIPSVNPSDGDPDDRLFGESRMADYLEGFFRRHRIDCARQEARPGRDSVVAVVPGRSPDLVILEAHTDTVSVEGMEIDPFDPRLEDGRVFGRGACDDKGSLAAMLIAFSELVSAGTPERTCVLAATCDEEYRFSGIRALMDRPEEAGLTAGQLSRAMACVGEPTGLRVVIAHKGAFRWRMRTRGKAAHSSTPEEGENAIYTMARLVESLQRYAESLSGRPAHPLVGKPTFSVGTIAGGRAVNIVPDLCEILVDRRLVPGEDGEAAEAEIRRWIAEAVPAEMETLLEDWPLETDPDAEIVKRTRRALGALGLNDEPMGVNYGTDASKMARAGVECVVCGPGDIGQAHTVTEWVAVEQVEAAVGLYRGILTGV